MGADMLTINQYECIACGLCVKQSPELFALDEFGFAFVKKAPKSLDQDLSLLLNKCPANCIIWEQA